MKKLFLFFMVFIFSVSLFILTSSSIQADERPPGGGLTISVQKPIYKIGENVVFILVKYAGVDDTPANLTGCYYIISKQKDNGKWREFYTSKRDPFNFTTLGLEKKFRFKWDQKDNERTHRAKPGDWRIKFFAPHGNISKPLIATFKIE